MYSFSAGRLSGPNNHLFTHPMTSQLPVGMISGPFVLRPGQQTTFVPRFHGCVASRRLWDLSGQDNHLKNPAPPVGFTPEEMVKDPLGTDQIPHAKHLTFDFTFVRGMTFVEY